MQLYEYVLCFSYQATTISLHSTDWIVCITETECVYWAEQAQSLNKIQVNRVYAYRNRSWGGTVFRPFPHVVQAVQKCSVHNTRYRSVSPVYQPLIAKRVMFWQSCNAVLRHWRRHVSTGTSTTKIIRLWLSVSLFGMDQREYRLALTGRNILFLNRV
jgi:hypothetical protein